MKKGKKTNITGTQLEKTIQTTLKDKGFEIENYQMWEKNPNKYGKEILLKNAPFTTIYNHKGYTEFLLISEKYDLKIRIECKWQQSAGSVDEKLPYLYLNTIEAMPETNIIIVIDGKGFKKGAKEWLKNSVQERRYTSKKNNGKNIQVLSISDFLAWANDIFSN